MGTVTITEIMNGPWRERAIYTAEERGIPSFADGLKPVQRYLVCKALKVAKSKFEKVATISTIATVAEERGIPAFVLKQEQALKVPVQNALFL